MFIVYERKTEVISVYSLYISTKFKFLWEDKADSGEDKISPSVIGGTISEAGGEDTAELAALYAISPSARSAFSVRPDPDTYIVNLLSQFRERDISLLCCRKT